jgi:hypothetical protein
MITKEIKIKAKKHRDLILIMIPLIIATIVVVFNLMPAELLGFFSDAYTIALLFTLVIITALATKRRSKK